MPAKTKTPKTVKSPVKTESKTIAGPEVKVEPEVTKAPVVLDPVNQPPVGAIVQFKLKASVAAAIVTKVNKDTVDLFVFHPDGSHRDQRVNGVRPAAYTW